MKQITDRFPANTAVQTSFDARQCERIGILPIPVIPPLSLLISAVSESEIFDLEVFHSGSEAYEGSSARKR
jgi:hypothetical protein